MRPGPVLLSRAPYQAGKLAVFRARGGLVRINALDGRCTTATTIAQLPGYTRGLALCRDGALVGLSKIRDQKAFGEVPIAQQASQLRCGVWAVDLRTGDTIEFIEFVGDVTGVFDAQLLRGVRFPAWIGLEKDTVQRAFSIPGIGEPTAQWRMLAEPDSDQAAHGPGRSRDAARYAVPQNQLVDAAINELVGVDSAESHAAGSIFHWEYLGAESPAVRGQRAAEVYYLRFHSLVDRGVRLAAKLFLPAGDAPASGWPVSMWCHGLGDPATQLARWPLVAGPWRRTRGQLAGRWAHDGIATMTLWLPGDGPSEPLGTYSPLSLARNTRAVVDALLALRNLSERVSAHRAHGDRPLALDLTQWILRTDCVASPLLVYFAAQWRQHPAAEGLRVLVADDFQPGIAHNAYYLGPRLNQLSGLHAAAIRCIWMRVLVPLFLEQHGPLDELLSEKAIALLIDPVTNNVGPLPRLMASRLVPPDQSELASRVLSAAAQQLGPSPTGWEIIEWMRGPQMARWESLGDLQAMVRDPFYQQRFAAADPFFDETIEPFNPGVPLLVIGRAGPLAAGLAGLPSRDQLYQKLTLPKVQTLRRWGWQVRTFEPHADAGTSFSGGPAQAWALDQVRKEQCQTSSY